MASRQFLQINAINLTLGHLKQITSAVRKHKEQDLLKLDAAVTEYLIKRKTRVGGQDFRGDLQEGLCKLSASNEYALTELNVMMHAYQQECAAIATANSAILHEHPPQEYQPGSVAQLTRQVIEELGKHRNIIGLMEELKQRVREHGGHSSHSNEYAFKQYIRQMDQIIGEDRQREHEHGYGFKFKGDEQ